MATANSTAFDELYTNDGLQRLKDMQRGTLNGTNTAITSPNFSQCWTLDPTGNWRGFNESTTGSSWTLTQARTANPVNEITGITNSVGAAWVAPAYDAAGNMTTMPPASFRPTTGFTAIYDAWNRLVTVRAGVSNVQQNQYDARNFRVALLNYSGGVLSETRHAYFTSGWQCIEERVDAATTASRHFIWGARYIDDLVMRDRDSTGGGTFNQRNYALQDANWNVTTAVSSSGTVQERYAYSPYGTSTFLTPTFGPRANTSLSWETLYCGYRLDNNSRLYAVRFRAYHPALGAWCHRDSLNYHDGMNLYAYIGGKPAATSDASGLSALPIPIQRPTPLRIYPPSLPPTPGTGSGQSPAPPYAPQHVPVDADALFRRRIGLPDPAPPLPNWNYVDPATGINYRVELNPETGRCSRRPIAPPVRRPRQPSMAAPPSPPSRLFPEGDFVPGSDPLPSPNGGGRNPPCRLQKENSGERDGAQVCNYSCGRFTVTLVMPLGWQCPDYNAYGWIPKPFGATKAEGRIPENAGPPTVPYRVIGTYEDGTPVPLPKGWPTGNPGIPAEWPYY